MSDTDGDVYLIWSNEHGAWWGPGGCGYFERLSQAGRYPRAKAIAICVRAIPGDAHRMGMLPEIPVRLLDIETMRTAHHDNFPGRPPEMWE